MMLHLRERAAQPWEPVTTPAAAAAVIFAMTVGWIHGRHDGLAAWVPLLDDANLAFHEAGHMIFGLLGGTLGLYGGTLGQLVFPVTCLGVFWHRRHPASYVVCGTWLAANLFNIARYIADARARELPLAGGGEHDWLHILARWRALEADLSVARFVDTTAWLTLIATTAWLLWRWRRKPE